MLTHKKYLEKDLEISKIMLIFALQKTTTKINIMKLYNVVELINECDVVSICVTNNKTVAVKTLINNEIKTLDNKYTNKEICQMSQEALEAFDYKLWWQHDDTQRIFFCVEIEINDTFLKKQLKTK